MIKVNDLSGTVTMSLVDYELIRDREDTALISLKEKRAKFAKQRSEFNNDLIKRTYMTPTEINLNNSGSYGIRYDEQILWVDRDDAIKEVAELNRKLRDKVSELIGELGDIPKFSVHEFIVWKKRMLK